MEPIEAFERVARDARAMQLFRAGIGAWNAPSRLLAAHKCAGARNVIDVGCGPGVFLRTLVETFAPNAPPFYFGIDGSRAMIAAAIELDQVLTAQGKLRPGRDRTGALSHAWGAAAFDVYDVASEAMPFRWNTMVTYPRTPCVVVARHVLEHHADPLPALRGIIRLAPDPGDSIVLVYSQGPLLTATSSRPTDQYLDCPRWAHAQEPLERELVGAGFHVAERWGSKLYGGGKLGSESYLAPREVLWLATRSSAATALTSTLHELDRMRDELR